MTLSLFKSALAHKLLTHFFRHPEAQLYVNELAKSLRLDKRNLVKKLHEFEAAGLLKKQLRGNLKLYSVNPQYPLYNEYRSIVLASGASSSTAQPTALNFEEAALV